MAPKRAHAKSNDFIDDSDASSEAQSSGSESKPKKAKKATPKKVAKKSPVAKKKKAKKEESDDEAINNDDSDGEINAEEKEGGGAVVMKKNKEGDKYFEMSGSKRVTVRKYKGTVLIDIRETYSKDGVDGLPGKKGISLNRDQWRDVLDGADAINAAIEAL